MTSRENETILVKDTTLLYHPDPENNFTVTVVPLNEVGAGQPATSRPFLLSLLLSEIVNINTLYYQYTKSNYFSVINWYTER